MATSKNQFEYKTILKDITTSSENIHNRDTIKIIKETTFANLASKTQKERNYFHQKEFKYEEPNAGHNATVNHFIFQPYLTTLKPRNLKDNFHFSDPIVDDKLDEEQTSAQSQNLLNTIDQNLEVFLKESMKNKALIEKKNQTFQKPEYISIEEIKAENERLLGNLEGIETQFLQKKTKEKQLLKTYLNLNEGVNNILDEECHTLTGIRNIVEEEEKKTQKRSQLLKTFAMKELLKKGVFRIGYNNHNPVDDYDDKYIKKYAKYLLMKKIKDKVTGDEDDEYEREYETYFFTANSANSPTSLSINNDQDKKTTKEGQNNKNLIKTSQNPEEVNKSINSFVAFIKMIFAMIDKDQNGLVNKDNIENEMRLDDHILKDLGFDSNEDFIFCLHEHIKDSNEMTEKEFILFILSKSHLRDDIIQYLNINSNIPFRNSKSVGRSMRNKCENEIELSDDEETNLPGLKTHVYDFLNLNNDKMKLDKLKELFQTNNKTQTQTIPKKTIVKLVNQAVQISYHEYLTFLRRFHTKDQINFTIPKPFEFLKRDYQQNRIAKIKEILEERVNKEDALINYHFKANQLKENIWGNRMQKIIEYEQTKRKERQDKLKEQIVADMKPFSFYEADERKYREKLQQECQPPTFPVFRANAVRWMSQVNLYEDMIQKQLLERQQRVKERMEKTMKASKLPPRMEMHANELKKKEEENMNTKAKAQTPTKHRFKANPVPDFVTLQEQFESQLEQKKRAAVPTEPIPFTFHEPKKKMELRNYLDNENNPKVRNPQVKTDISSVIEKMQRKPKYEPSTTKSLSLLMEARRKEIEEKQRKEEERMLEDELRREKQERLRERVQTSKAIVDNKRELAENRKRIQDDFKVNLQKKKDSYDVELQRRLQKVYNRPLMIEQIGNKSEKFTLTRNMKDDLNDILLEQGEEEQSEEIGQGNEEVDD